MSATSCTLTQVEEQDVSDNNRELALNSAQANVALSDACSQKTFV